MNARQPASVGRWFARRAVIYTVVPVLAAVAFVFGAWVISRPDAIGTTFQVGVYGMLIAIVTTTIMKELHSPVTWRFLAPLLLIFGWRRRD